MAKLTKYEYKKGDRVRTIGGEFETTLTERVPRLDDFGHGKAWRHTHDFGWLGEDQFELIKSEMQTGLSTTLPQEYVIHNGTVYVKEQRKANVGETVIITDAPEDYSFFSVGDIGKYLKDREVNFSDHGNKRVVSDGIWYVGPSASNTKYAVLSPVTSVTLNGTEYALEKRKATAGENVLVVETFVYGKSGDIATVTKSRRWAGDVQTDKHTLMNDARYVVLVPKKQTQPVTEYREVERKANVSERIRIVKAAEGETYANGEEFIVNKADSDGDVYVDYAGDNRHYVLYSEYVVLEPIDKPLEVGDYAKVIHDIYEYTTGDIVKLTAVKSKPSSFDFSIENVRTGKTGYVANSFITRATDEEVVAAKAEADRLEVGEYARVTVSGKDVEMGGIVQIEADDRDSRPFKGVKVNGKPGEWDWFQPNQLERVTEEEAKWAAIGRKVGEIKAGDIVKSTRTNEIGYAEFGHDFQIPCMGFRGPTGKLVSHSGGNNLELIAPVESLFTPQK